MNGAPTLSQAFIIHHGGMSRGPWRNACRTKPLWPRKRTTCCGTASSRDQKLYHRHRPKAPKPQKQK
eukprot:5881948-Amphidinium_carterae.1